MSQHQYEQHHPDQHMQEAQDGDQPDSDRGNEEQCEKSHRLGFLTDEAKAFGEDSDAIQVDQAGTRVLH